MEVIHNHDYPHYLFDELASNLGDLAIDNTVNFEPDSVASMIMTDILLLVENQTSPTTRPYILSQYSFERLKPSSREWVYDVLKFEGGQETINDINYINILVVAAHLGEFLEDAAGFREQHIHLMPYPLNR